MTVALLDQTTIYASFRVSIQIEEKKEEKEEIEEEGVWIHPCLG